MYLHVQTYTVVLLIEVTLFSKVARAISQSLRRIVSEWKCSDCFAMRLRIRGARRCLIFSSRICVLDPNKDLMTP